MGMDELPPPINEPGGVAMVIRGRMKNGTNAREKARDGKDLPPHMSSTSLARLLLDRKDVIQDGILGVASVQMTPTWRGLVNSSDKNAKRRINN